MMRANYLKNQLENNEIVVGTWSVIPSVITTEIIARSGIDFIIIDKEHGPVSFESAQKMSIACESMQISSVLRVSGVYENEISKAMDIGVHCIHIPNIESVKDVHRCIQYMKYPPRGKRGYSPFTRSGSYGITNFQKHTETMNTETLLCIHIENMKGIDCLEEILNINEVDIIFLGLFDLSKALKRPGDIAHSDVQELLKKLCQMITHSGKYPGTIILNKEQIQTYIDWGVRYFTYSVDCQILASAYADIAELFKPKKAKIWT